MGDPDLRGPGQDEDDHAEEVRADHPDVAGRGGGERRQQQVPILGESQGVLRGPAGRIRAQAGGRHRGPLQRVRLRRRNSPHQRETVGVGQGSSAVRPQCSIQGTSHVVELRFIFKNSHPRYVARLILEFKKFELWSRLGSRSSLCRGKKNKTRFIIFTGYEVLWHNFTIGEDIYKMEKILYA